MSVANKLFDRSHGFVGDINATNPDDLPALYISGTLPKYGVGIAYIGKLKINNAIGNCRVELLSGNLPAGYTLTVDNKTQQVVIRWPLFRTDVVAVPNGNFSSGDDGSWEMGPGFTIESTGTAPDPNDPGNINQLQFASLHADPDGPDTMSALYFPLADARNNGQTNITASADVQQGASSENQAGAAVRILFYDNVGLQVGGMDGNVIKSGSDSDWQTSTVNAPIPALASYARVGAVAYRKGQNRALWIDNIKWNLTQASQGTSTGASIPLSLRVTDSQSRQADWSGTIGSGHIITISYVAGGYYRTADKYNTSTFYSYSSTTSLDYYQDRFIMRRSDGILAQSFDGITWVNIAPIPAQFRALKATPSAIFVGTGVGLYRSVDGGLTWPVSPITPGFVNFVGYSPYTKADGTVGEMLIQAGNTMQQSIDGGDTWHDMVFVGGSATNIQKLCNMNGKLYAQDNTGVNYIWAYSVNSNAWINTVVGFNFSYLASSGDSLFFSSPGTSLYLTDDLINYTDVNPPSLNNNQLNDTTLGDVYLTLSGDINFWYWDGNKFTRNNSAGGVVAAITCSTIYI